MKNNCYFREPINMKAVNLDEEITVLIMQKRKNDKEEMKNEGRKPTSLPQIL